jgi:hypothetical protein
MIVTDMNEADAEPPAPEPLMLVPEDAVSPAPKPPAKRATKRRAPRKPAGTSAPNRDTAQPPARSRSARKPAAESEAAPEPVRAPAPPRRRLRRSVLGIPALLDPVLVPEDAPGRVEFIVRPLPQRPAPPAVKKIKGKRKAKPAVAEPEPAASVPWRVVMAMAAVMVVLFLAGVLVLR